MANPDPRLVQAIKRLGGQYAPILLATTLVESGGRLNAVGDGGMSIGPYQMHSRGRGYNVPPAKRMDPVFSTQSALAEFKRFAARGLSGPELAYAAQRPADKAGYIRKIAAALPEAQRILGATGGGPVRTAQSGGAPVAADPGAAPSSVAPGSIPGFAPQDAKALMALLNQTRQGVLQGQMPGPNYGSSLGKFAQILRAQVQAAAQQQAQPAAPAPGGNPANPTRQTQSVPDGPMGPLNYGQGSSGLAKILPGSPQFGSYGYSDPEGQGGRHLAVDWFAKGGTPVASPIEGTVVRVSSSKGNSGQVFGGTVGIRAPDGRLFVMRHIDPTIRQGARVTKGTQVGKVTNWAGGSSHIHFEAYRKGSSDREYSTGLALNPGDFYR